MNPNIPSVTSLWPDRRRGLHRRFGRYPFPVQGSANRPGYKRAVRKALSPCQGQPVVIVSLRSVPGYKSSSGQEVVNCFYYQLFYFRFKMCWTVKVDHSIFPFVSSFVQDANRGDITGQIVAVGVNPQTAVLVHI